MPQRLTDAQVNSVEEMVEEVIPALEGTEQYFALVEHKGKKVLCILDGDTWRVTTYSEMMGMM